MATTAEQTSTFSARHWHNQDSQAALDQLKSGREGLSCEQAKNG
jgi:hypothetical protein